MFQKLEQFITHDSIIQSVVHKYNQDYLNKIEPTKKELAKLTARYKILQDKRDKIFELVESDAISVDEFKERKEKIQQDMDNILEQKTQAEQLITECSGSDISFAEVKNILKDALPILKEKNPEKLNLLLHLMIEKIEITDSKDLDSITITINENLQNYIAIAKNSEGVPDGAPSIFVTRKKDVETIRFTLQF